MFNFTAEQHEQLEALQAQPHFKHRGGNPLKGTAPIVICELCDIAHEKKATTRQAFAKGEGGSEQAALADALSNADVRDRPMSPAQTATALKSANDELSLKDKEIAELKAALAGRKSSSSKKAQTKKDVAPAESE